MVKRLRDMFQIASPSVIACLPSASKHSRLVGYLNKTLKFPSKMSDVSTFLGWFLFHPVLALSAPPKASSRFYYYGNLQLCTENLSAISKR